MSLFSRNCDTASNDVVAPQPNPRNFTIRGWEAYGDYVVASITYPGCLNYEGRKVLVFKTSVAELLNRKSIDPHFEDDALSPIARFKPTQEGWKQAVAFVHLLNLRNTT